jgi:catecholate siderophore receptor
MGTLVAYSAVGTKTIAIACAQNTQGVEARPPAQGNLPALLFSIPAGPLDTVLDTFAKVTGLKVKVSDDGIRSVLSPGVSGVFTSEQALRKLLAATGIDGHFVDSGTVALELTSVNTSVQVSAAISALATSTPKYAGPSLDTPQTINDVPRQVMDQQGTTTLRDALRNVAGISLAAGEGGAQGDNLTIRGFTARNDLFIDGMRDFGSYYRDPFNVQEVEVLQGPSSVTFGRGSTGGVVNQASKTPHPGPAISGDFDFGTDLTRRVTLDVNEPLAKLGPGAAFRVNLMGNQGNVAGRDVAENRRFGIAPSLALGLGTPTRWTFSYFHQNADDNPDYGIPWLFNGPAPVNRTNYYGFEKGNYLRTYDDIGTVRVEHDFNGGLTLRNQVRYANYARRALITEPQIVSPTLSTPLDAMQASRRQIGVASEETYLVEQLDVTAQLQSGPFKHTLMAGIEAGRESSDPTRPTWTNVPTTSLLNPDPNQPFSGAATIASIVHTTAVSAAAYALDTIQLGRKWIVTGGIRWDRFSTDYSQAVVSASAFSRVDEMSSWRAALVYKPLPFGTVYFDAGTSFNPSAESLSLTASTVSLPPEKNKTYEFGTKWDVSNGRISLRGALFRTEKTNAREPDPTNPLLNVLAGNQRVDGVQVGASGRLTSRWEILASYAYLDSKVVRSQYYPASVGRPLANVPANTFNLWTEWLRPTWELGAGCNYVSSRTASSTAPFDPTTGLLKEVPGYWVFNAMAERRLNEHLELQANVYNLANRYYYDELHPAHIVLGPGRSALIGFKFKF